MRMMSNQLKKGGHQMTAKIDLKRLLKILIIILIVAVWLIVVILSGKFIDLLSGPGLAFLLLGGAAMILMGFSGPEIGAAFKHAAGSPGNRERLQKSAYFWETAVRNFWMLGVLGGIIGFIIALCVSRGGLGPIASGMAESALTTVCGMILGVICLVPALKLTGKLNKQPLPEGREMLEKQGEKATTSLRFENIIGYALFIAVMGWTIILPLVSKPINGPLNPWKIFINLPSLIVVLGGTIALVMFMGDASAGRSFTLSFALTGGIGSLVGFVQAIMAMSSRVIADVASGVSFIISSCFIAFLGIMLVGIPLEDRTVKTGRNRKGLTLSRIAWYVFPLVTLIFLIIVFILVITPIKKVV
jgi:hypothetical protein